MSVFTNGAAEAMMNVPTRMIGVMSRRPARMPHASATLPMIGRITRPGSTHRDATENPNERIFGGIASDSDAKMPGATIAITPETMTFMAIAMPRFGVRAKMPNAMAATTPTPATNLRTRPGSFVMSRVANGMPASRPMNAAGSASAATKPRSAAPRWNTCS